MSIAKNTVRLSPADNVVTALRPLAVGDEGATTLIPRGHKMAAEPIAAGAPVLKYAQVIGYAAEDIPAGAHVHTHNLEFRGVAHDYAFATNLRPAPEPETSDTFMGYRRESGRVGTRNYIAVLTSVNCSATAARMIAAALHARAAGGLSQCRRRRRLRARHRLRHGGRRARGSRRCSA